jgi:hypothetical protein
MGFGKINAYRAVAHSIRNKGEYSYILNAGNNLTSCNFFKAADANGDSRGYVVDGNRVCHLGS